MRKDLKHQLQVLLKEPWRIGTRDRYIQEGIVYLAQRILAEEDLIKVKRDA